MLAIYLLCCVQLLPPKENYIVYAVGISYREISLYCQATYVAAEKRRPQ